MATDEKSSDQTPTNQDELEKSVDEMMAMDSGMNGKPDKSNLGSTDSENDGEVPANNGSPGNEIDAQTDKMVDDIVAKESDDLLKAEDAKLVQAALPPKSGFGTRLKNFFTAWWQNPF